MTGTEKHTKRPHPYERRERPRTPRPEETETVAPENVVCGRNAIRELLAGEKDIEKIYVQKGDRDGGLIRLLKPAVERHIPVLSVERQKLDEMAGTTAHQGVVATLPAVSYATVEDMLALAEERGEKPLLVLCDGIEDPHNLGAVIRSAECAGAHGIIIAKRRASGLTAVVSKASAGAIAYLPIARVTNLSATIRDLKDKGLWIYACDMDGDNYAATDLTGPAVLVLGNEGDGISRLVREACDYSVSIPLYGHVNSLNVSNAAAVILCEAARQRHAD